jgi:hypothetical protein
MAPIKLGLLDDDGQQQAEGPPEGMAAPLPRGMSPG